MKKLQVIFKWTHETKNFEVYAAPSKSAVGFKLHVEREAAGVPAPQAILVTVEDVVQEVA